MKFALALMLGSVLAIAVAFAKPQDDSSEVLAQADATADSDDDSQSNASSDAGSGSIAKSGAKADNKGLANAAARAFNNSSANALSKANGLGVRTGPKSGAAASAEPIDGPTPASTARKAPAAQRQSQ